MARRPVPRDVSDRSGGGRANDQISDYFTAHALDLLRLEAGQRKRVRAFLVKLEMEIVDLLKAIDPTEPVRQAYRQRRLENLLEQVRGSIRGSYRSINTTMVGELQELADIEASLVGRAINGSVGFQLATETISRNQLVAIVDATLIQGAPTTEWWSRQAGDVFERFTDEVRKGMALGETNSQIVQRIRGGVRNGERLPGIMDITGRNADRLVRSSVQGIANEARELGYRQNADILKGVQWAATLDMRTTTMCMVRDGKMYDAVTHEPIGHEIPWGEGPGRIHWSCRSSSVPVTKSWRELGFDMDDLPPSTRASMDGQVPADQTFEDWLKKQSAARQDESLGAGRAELWRDGKIAFKDLLDQNGRELSLEELRERL